MADDFASSITRVLAVGSQALDAVSGRGGKVSAVGTAVQRALMSIRSLGWRRSLEAALYPLRRRYYDAAFADGVSRASALRGISGVLAPAAPDEFRTPEASDLCRLGDVIGYGQSGRTITVRCTNGSLVLTVLTANIIRVWVVTGDRGSVQDDPRFVCQSYSVAKDEAEWPAQAFQVFDGDDLEIRTTHVSCRIRKSECVVTFWTHDGQWIHGESESVGWKGKHVVRQCKLLAQEHVYGLGERAFGLDRRGQRYMVWNADPQVYSPGDDPLYLSVPFYTAFHDGLAYGLFYDNTYRAVIDLGAEVPDRVTYMSSDGDLVYYLLFGPTLAAVIEDYTELTGRMPLPPLWTLGFHQSRWSYYPEQRVREIAERFRQHAIPCDSLHLDIHYMDDYRCFTWHPERFPNPAGLIKDLHAQGFHVVTLIDCGIKADRSDATCRDGLKQEVFCRYPDGLPAGGPVWPGEALFPDFTDPKVRAWWGGLCASFARIGVDGIWNDMNEPTVIAAGGDTLANCVRHSWDGQGCDHRKAHNVYGMQMLRATVEGLQRLRPTERPFAFTRSGWAGVQRYGYSWTGDNESTWNHLCLTPAMVMGLGLSGIAFTGPDVGGFGGTPSPEQLTRWTQLGAFLPFFRNHTAIGTPDQEPWAHGEPYLSLNREAIELRYQLLPYLYTAIQQCAQHGWPLVRPMSWYDLQDEETHTLDDQFLCGDALLVAPVCQPEQRAREVYLPAGEWYDFWSDAKHTGPGWIQVAAPLDRIPLLVRAGTVLPMWPVQQYINLDAIDQVILHVYPGAGESWLYQDDGHSTGYLKGDWLKTRFAIDQQLSRVSVAVQAVGSYCPAQQHWLWEVHGLLAPPKRTMANGSCLPNVRFDATLNRANFETQAGASIELE